MKQNILLVANESNFLRILYQTLLDEGYQARATTDPFEALSMIEKELYDLVITDLVIPHFGGLELMIKIKSYYPELPVIIFSGFATIEAAVECIKKGAYDFFKLPFELTRLMGSVQKALEHDALCKDLMNFRQEIQKKYLFDLIGRNTSMSSISALISHVAGTDTPIIIQGDDGLRRETIALIIHYQSSRKNYPFFPIDCGTLSASSLDSDLFGHIKGSFAGAYRARRGLFELAKGGTVFLDEVQDMPSGTQSKLLSALEENEIQPIGSGQIHKIDLRIIVGTNKDLKEIADSGAFREDLYCRLAQALLVLPS
ncbi:MAG: sigma-54-dependent transcriptional regulator [bacterium]